MKLRVFTVFLIAALLLSGCSSTAAERDLNAAGNGMRRGVDAVEDAVENAVTPSSDRAAAETGAAKNRAATQSTAAAISREKAESIALAHAGLAADQVTYLHTEYEIDDGRPQYEVQFHYERWEYDYEIDAETGSILSFERDD